MKLQEDHADARGNPLAFRAPQGAPPNSSTAANPLVLPPNTSREHFKTFARRAGDICGVENVTIITDPAELYHEQYTNPGKAHDMSYLLDKEYFVASAVIAPRHVQDVQDMMKLCNEFEIPVWPVSIGRNVGYGGAAPRVPGSIAMDLGRYMNKILSVDTEGAYALLEPGVTFFDLYNYLEQNQLLDKVWPDVPDLGGGSVVGNTVERGVGYTPMGDHWSMHSGLEVVLPSGELVRTGMGALPDPTVQTDAKLPPDQQPGNRCWQLFNYGFGPYNDGIFSQASNGIVTKMGLWLMPNPGGYQAFMITVPREDDLHAALEIIRPLRLQNVLQNVPTLRHITLDAAFLHEKAYYTSKTTPLDDDDIEDLKKKLDLGHWNFYGALYGPDPIREVFWKTIKEAFSKIPGAKFYFPEERKEHTVLHVRANTLKGKPSLDELQWTHWYKPNGSHLFFSPISKISGDDAMEQYHITKRACKDHGFDFIGTFLVGMREMHHIVNIVFDRTDAEERNRARNLMRTLIKECADKGWGEYRTHLALMDLIADTYNFNDNAQMKLNETIKDALDPKGILMPGKNGIWPRGYDKSVWKLS